MNEFNTNMKINLNPTIRVNKYKLESEVLLLF